MGDGAGALEETQLQAVIQLESATVLTGTETDATDLGVFRTEDEGLQIWGRSDHGLEGTSGDIRDFLEQAVALDARDTFCAVNGTTDGGIFLSADDGRHWIGISEGFDPDNQTLSSIISDGGTPPTYYAGTYSHGSYATTIQPLDPPSISGLDVSSGSAAGGTSVTVTGSNFLCSCPEDYDCLPGQEQTIVSFGGADGATDTCTTTSLTVTTNAHAPGLVDVTVRNPDTRSDTLGAAFTFEGTPGISITLDRDVSNNVEISWTGGSPATVYRSHRPDFAWGVIQDTLSSNPYTYSDASGTDSNLYFYRVE